MDIIKTAFETAKEGDRIIMSFPDIYSFYYVMKWIYENFGEIFWILWTDAAVERINHLGKRYGFPSSGDALVVGSGRECKYLNCIERVDVYSDISRLMRALPLDNKIIVSFGIDFIDVFGYELSRVIEMIIEHDRGILVTTVLGDIPEKLVPFHDIVIKIVRSETSYVTYRNYVAKVMFSMKGGFTEVSDAFTIQNDPLV